jgi:hypothetical protein
VRSQSGDPSLLFSAPGTIWRPLSSITADCRQKWGVWVMNLIILLVVLILLFGGGGFYYGGPYVGGGLGTILIIVLIVILLRGA